MRIIPILSALLVTAALYGIIIERESLMAWAYGEDPATAEAQEKPKVDAAADRAAKPAHDPVRVITRNSTARDIDSAVVLRGETAAMRTVELRAETSGAVISSPIRKGSEIAEGDLLCEIDPGTREDSLAEAEAKLAEARAAVPSSEARVIEAQAMLTEAKINQNAASKLSQGGFAAETRVASADAAVSSAEASVAQAEGGLSTAQAAIRSAEAAVASANRELERTQIAAPFAGLLDEDAAERGSLLQAGSLCATILQLDPVKLVGFIPETQVSRVQVGANAMARLAASDREVMGKVTFLSRSADPQTRTFRVEIEVPNPDLSIRDGQTAEIAIAAPGTPAHLLPQSALTLNDDGDLGIRIVEADNLAGFVPVKLLRDTPEGVWVTGLPDTAQVIVIGQDYVIPGVPVTPTVQDSSE
ncbi:efflux RND transporter periplasmic adaptor subunit [Pseudooceanicola sp. C21-150M6]|uniref:efflux RND transporter periplasmic adaptor subunit n=1 Tax=Pseudooceanicola sp. C21-150M6 TaxID=3434355 RepID=UPI003D7FE3D1